MPRSDARTDGHPAPHEGVLDLTVINRIAAIAGERPDVRSADLAARIDEYRPDDPGPADLRTGLDRHPTVDLGTGVDRTVQPGSTVSSNNRFTSSMSATFPVLCPPSTDDCGRAHVLIDQPLMASVISTAPRQDGLSAHGLVHDGSEHALPDERDAAFRRLLRLVLRPAPCPYPMIIPYTMGSPASKKRILCSSASTTT